MGGRAIYADKAIVDIDGANMNNNSAHGDGGVMWLRSVVNATINNSTMRHNRATDNGGVMSVSSGDVGLHISNCTLEANFAQNGGVVKANLNIHFSETLISSNVAEATGGLLDPESVSKYVTTL
ncbi:hypothetical protein CYMTET_6873 [Cymbomonas tetramitiformis]|uniref:Right handed beta helix domain-containing protein n=1 Tax=Cymbomonas tetramitiformis TaxID=36881 RepID=A0AAE0LHK6_9CHLO|nr:hypothetical protein CYMTET_6873 [Cymbomonas tetramitiformis]